MKLVCVYVVCRLTSTERRLPVLQSSETATRMLVRCGVSMPFQKISQMSHAVSLAFPFCSFLPNVCCMYSTILDTWSPLLS